MNRNLTYALIISVLVHVFFFVSLIYYNIRGEKPLGGEFVSVEIIGEETDLSSPPLAGDGQGAASPPFAKGGQVNNSREAHPLQASTGETSGLNGNSALSSAAETLANGHEGQGGPGSSPGSATGSPILTKIRAKIERSKYYPQQARLQRLEGRPEVSFKIAPDGTIGSLRIKRSSGSDLLDSAAIETVRRAAPLPFYEDEIRLAIKYSLLGVRLEY